MEGLVTTLLYNVDNETQQLLLPSNENSKDFRLRARLLQYLESIDTLRCIIQTGSTSV